MSNTNNAARSQEEAKPSTKRDSNPSGLPPSGQRTQSKDIKKGGVTPKVAASTQGKYLIEKEDD